MAAAKKKGLPEITITAEQNSGLIAKAKEALALRAQIAELTAKEDTLKKQIAEAAIAIRKDEETNKGQYIGNVKLVDENQQTSQVQFRVMASLVALGLNQEATLDALYGTGRTYLFGKQALGTIQNHQGLWEEIIAQGKNPMDLLDVNFKPGMDKAFIGSPNVTFEEFFLPLEGFLATSNEQSPTWGPKTKKYHAAYLDQVLKPAVSLGHK